MDRARRIRAAAAAGLFAVLCPCVWALNPALDISQYAHTSWTIRDGFFESAIQTIAQTPDGYLWLGTQFGLLRFDGVRKVAWNPPAGESLPSANVTNLLMTRDGRLWIGTRAGLASWKDGRFLQYPVFAEQIVGSLAEDEDGTVWVGTLGSPYGRLCAIRSGSVHCSGQDGSLGTGLFSLFAENGNLWAGAVSGVWRWKPDPPKRFPSPDPRGVNAFFRDGDGPLLMATAGGLKELAGERIEASPIAGAASLRAQRLLRDRKGGLWIGSMDRGLVHVHQGRTDQFNRSDGLSGDNVYSLFEDREGSIWAATFEGLDRFRDFAIPTMSSKQGLAGDFAGAVLATRDGSVWIGGIGGLSRWKNGQITNYRKRDGLPNDAIHELFEDSRGRIWVSTNGGLARQENDRFEAVPAVPGATAEGIAEEGDGSLWIGDVQQGLIHLLGTEVMARIPWAALGHVDNATCLTRDAKRGGIWVGFRQGGVVFFKDGQVRNSYAASQGLGTGMVTGVFPQPDSSVWAATEGGLSRIKDGHIATLSSRNGLPCDSVRTAIEDDDHAVWLYMACGLVRISRSEFEAWVADTHRAVKTMVFDPSDGAVKQAVGGYRPKAARLNDGQLWFATNRGVSMVDPHHLPENKTPAPVHIEEIVADDQTLWQNLTPSSPASPRLPALTHRLEIRHTALSFVAPEKIRFRYMLEGYDRGWQDGRNGRHAAYTNLPPRKYRFRVIASNNSGVWNQTGDTLEFSISPAYYQTSWFYAACIAAFLAAVWGLFRLRLYQVRREFNAQLDGRVDGRMRVARELHDTLLQSFQASLIQMQAARNIFSRRPEKAEESLDKAITTAAGAIAEGRGAIQDLRGHPAGDGDLAQLLTAAAQELAHSHQPSGNPPVFRLTVEGERQDLDPLLQDEVYRIARELLRNAFRHAQAPHIEVEIRYETRQLRLHVRDDGKGIDPEILKAGARAGHWGLPGMRERANRLGANLDFWSEAGAGTEAVLTVPGAVAYPKSSAARGWWARIWAAKQ